MGARNRAAGSGVAAWAGGERPEEVGVCGLRRELGRGMSGHAARNW